MVDMTQAKVSLSEALATSGWLQDGVADAREPAIAPVDLALIDILGYLVTHRDADRRQSAVAGGTAM